MFKIQPFQNRYYLMDGRLCGSVHSLNQDEEYMFEYMNIFDKYVTPNCKVLMLGGGGYTWPQHFLKHFTGTIDVIEIDPTATELAREYFGLHNDPRLRIIHADARDYIKQLQGPYDLIINDMFVEINPVYLNITDIQRLLTPTGVYLQNITGQPEFIRTTQGKENNTVIVWNNPSKLK